MAVGYDDFTVFFTCRCGKLIAPGRTKSEYQHVARLQEVVRNVDGSIAGFDTLFLACI